MTFDATRFAGGDHRHDHDLSRDGRLWAHNIPGPHAFTWLQSQPIAVDLPANVDPASFPAGWFVNTPGEYDGWRRQLVHLPTVAWHDVYLLGLIVVAAGVAVRQHRGRRLALVGGSLAAIGAIAQLVVSPF